MIVVEVITSPADFLLKIRNGETRRKFTIADALNKTALAIQERVRARVLEKFTVRKRDFILRQAAIIKFAKAQENRMEASVRVGDKPNLLLGEFEEGGVRVGQKALAALGHPGVAVPITGGARSSREEVIPEPLWVQKLKLRPRGSGFAGERGAYFLPRVGVFLREGGETRPQYVIAKGVVKIPKQLGFYDIANAEAEKFPVHLDKAIAETVRFQKGLGRL